MSRLTKTLSGLLFLLCLCVVFLFLANVGLSYLWIYEEDAVKGNSLQMGAVELSMSQEELPLVEEEYNFTITSNSTIDFYLRMGYTILCKDANGNAVPVNIPDDMMMLSVSGIEVGGREFATTSRVQQVSAHGFSKNVVAFIALGTENHSTFPAGEGVTITGTVKLSFDEEKYSRFVEELETWEGEAFLVLTPEAIQATNSALEQLSAYGWKII